jgi:hypothetical protein
MKRNPTPTGRDKAQRQRFIEAAREAEAGEDEAVFDENLKRITKAKPNRRGRTSREDCHFRDRRLSCGLPVLRRNRCRVLRRQVGGYGASRRLRRPNRDPHHQQ